MPKPSPLPRKYASLVDEALSNLRLMAQKANGILAQLEASPRVSSHVQTALRELETLAYRTALDLAEIEVAGGCDGCPSAPPMTQVQAHLLVLADTLEQQAAAARLCAMAPLDGTERPTSSPSPLSMAKNGPPIIDQRPRG